MKNGKCRNKVKNGECKNKVKNGECKNKVKNGECRNKVRIKGVMILDNDHLILKVVVVST